MLFPGTLAAMGKAALQGNEVEKKLTSILYDDLIQVLSSFELNQIASLTYHEASIADGEDLCDLIFEIISNCISKPMINSALTIEKALVVTKHCLLVGSERVIKEANVLGRYIDNLQTYNTVLLLQQQQGLTGTLMRLKGGGVDKGGPIREKAKELMTLMTNQELLRFERQKNADPNSLVPVGNDSLVFATDEVRLYALKKRIEHQRMIQIKSNLTKADGGFGGGYNSRDGSSVVGAAHGLDEMMKMAEIHKKRFSDEKKKFSDNPKLSPAYQSYLPPSIDDESLLASLAHDEADRAETSNSHVEVNDLLSFDPVMSSSLTATQQAPLSVDLLGLTESSPQAASLSATQQAPLSMDLLGLTDSSPQNATASSFEADLLGDMIVTAESKSPINPLVSLLDPLGNISSNSNGSAATKDVWAVADLVGTMTIADTASKPETTSSVELSLLSDLQQPVQASLSSIKPVMSSNEDRFAALDALSSSTASKPDVNLSSEQAAFNRIMFGNSLVGLEKSLSQTAPSSKQHISSNSNKNAENQLSSYSPDAMKSISVFNGLMSPSTVPNATIDSVMQKRDVEPADYTSSISSMYATSRTNSTAAINGSLMDMIGLQDSTMPAVDLQLQQQTIQATYTAASLKISSQYTSPSWGSNHGGLGDEGEDNAFVMGGSEGTGLQPFGSAPAAPPPPPPSFF